MIWIMMMLEIRRSTQFKKDLKKIIKQRKNLDLLEDIVQKLQHSKPLDPKHRDHVLVGNWNDHRECHINPDWLLIYKVDEALQLLRLMRTGSHSDLFQ